MTIIGVVTHQTMVVIKTLGLIIHIAKNLQKKERMKMRLQDYII